MNHKPDQTSAFKFAEGAELLQAFRHTSCVPSSRSFIDTSLAPRPIWRRDGLRCLCPAPVSAPHWPIEAAEDAVICVCRSRKLRSSPGVTAMRAGNVHGRTYPVSAPAREQCAVRVTPTVTGMRSSMKGQCPLFRTTLRVVHPAAPLSAVVEVEVALAYPCLRSKCRFPLLCL